MASLLLGVDVPVCNAGLILPDRDAEGETAAVVVCGALPPGFANFANFA